APVDKESVYPQGLDRPPEPPPGRPCARSAAAPDAPPPPQLADVPAGLADKRCENQPDHQREVPQPRRRVRQPAWWAASEAAERGGGRCAGRVAVRRRGPPRRCRGTGLVPAVRSVSS